MIMDTLSFTFLIALVTFISATAFTTRFHELDTQFSNIFSTMRYLFDATVANYEYEEYGKYHRAFSIFLMIHIVVTNVFLLNYLIAVIDSIY